MKRTLPKINTIHCGGKWLATGVITGGVIPLIIWIAVHRIIWPLVIAGGIILAAFGVVFAIERVRGYGSVPHFEKHLKETIPFDPDRQYAVIRSSVCTGEKIAGFKNIADGHFTEVMVIRSPQEEQRFKEIYHLETIKTEY